MAQSKYFPDLQNGVDDADVEQIEKAFSDVETDMNKKLETVNTSDIVDRAVTAQKIDTGAITENKLADNAVTYNKLDSNLRDTLDNKVNNKNAYNGFEAGENAWAYDGVSIGENAYTLDGVAIGKNARCDANTDEEETSLPITAIQIGAGTNSKKYTAKLYDYELLADAAATPSETDGKKYLKDVGVLGDLQIGQGLDIVSALNLLKSLSIPHTSVQDYPLSITDSLAGENLTACNVWGGGRNLIPYPYQMTTKTESGITFTDNGDGSITVSGTATSSIDFTLCRFAAKKGVKYFISGCPTGGSKSTYYLHMRGYNQDFGKGAIINCSRDFTNTVDIVINAGTTVENLVFKPQLELGTTATEYEPYKTTGDLSTADNKYHIPIQLCGKNVLPPGYASASATRNGVEISVENGAVSFNGTATADTYFIMKKQETFTVPKGIYTLSGGTPDMWLYIEAYNGATRLWQKYDKGSGVTFDLTNITYTGIRLFTVVSSGKTVNITLKPQIEFGSIATDYEPYSTTVAAAILDTPLTPGEYIDLIRKKRVNGSTETDIAVTGTLKTVDSDVNNIMCDTTVAPSKINIEYYQDINKVIAEIKNAILAQGGNT